MTQKRKRYKNDFKLEVGIEALKEKSTLSSLASKYEVHASQITKWKKEVESSLLELLDSGKKPNIKDQEKLVQQLFEQIGKLNMELEWLKKKHNKYQLKTGLNG